jgi:hypothetical protein
MMLLILAGLVTVAMQARKDVARYREIAQM